MENKRNLVFMGIGAGLFVLILIVIAVVLNRAAPKVTQMHNIGSQYHMVSDNGVVTFIDNNNNIQQYTESTKTLRFVSSVDITMLPQLSETGTYITTTARTGQIGTNVWPLAQFGGNGGFGLTRLNYVYSRWGSGNLLVGLTPNQSSNAQSQAPADATRFNGKVSLRDASNINQIINQSPGDLQFESIAYTDRDRLITTNTQQDGSELLKLYNLSNWQEASQIKLDGLIEYYQAKQTLLMRASGDSSLVVVTDGQKQYNTNLQLSPYFAYPIKNKQLCILIQNKDNLQLGVYDLEGQKITRKYTLPNFVFQPNQVVTTDKNVYISTNSGMFVVENFLGGFK